MQDINFTNEELVARIKAGINVADNMLRLWNQTKRFIRLLAKRYEGQAELEDLEQEGYLALYDAIDGYDSGKGVKFLTYAEYWIKRRMTRYIQSNTAVRLPANEWGNAREYRKTVNAFQVYLGRKPTRNEIAYNMGLSVEQVAQIEKNVRMERIASLESPLFDEADGTLGDTVASGTDVEGDVLDDVQAQHLNAELWAAVDLLPEEQADIIRMRYKGSKTVREIGELIGLTGGKVRRLEVKALRELRHSDLIYPFCEYLPDAIGSGVYYGGVGQFNHTWTSSTERAALKLSEPKP